MPLRDDGWSANYGMRRHDESGAAHNTTINKGDSSPRTTLYGHGRTGPAERPRQVTVDALTGERGASFGIRV